jgi:hypothetical protein
MGMQEFPISTFDFQIQPNPTSSTVLVQSSSLLQGQKYQLTNLNGTVLFEGKLTDRGQVQLDLSHLARGIYIIQIYHPDNRADPLKPYLKILTT